MSCSTLLRLFTTILAILLTLGWIGPPLSSEAADTPASPPKSAESDSQKPGKPNRLGQESSPYLQLHAHNPVDWFPWGDEAFAKAKRENKPIFLSVGYSSCYWCHVMERETFTDVEIAKFLNENFVCIKVDREERPDIDTIYMMAIQLVTRRGGWPMSVFLTPDAKPFFGGTYFPARDGDRGNQPGFFPLAQKIVSVWRDKEGELRQAADQLTTAVQQNLDGILEDGGTPTVGDEGLLQRVQDALAESFDPDHGGFGFDPGNPQQPKFPEPSNLMFLLHRAQGGNQDALRMLDSTLQRMVAGGIWDHVGGGFHRYSVDRFWRIPHFEKMLYDNGQLCTVYAEAYALTKKDEYREVVEQLIAFILREMRDRQGAFYAALDAESEAVEGKFYRWDQGEVEKLLGADFDFYARIFGLDGPPNFEAEFHLLQRADSLEQLAQSQQVSTEELRQKLVPLHDKLLAARNKRPRPLTDTKILTSWNGLMIRGLADAGRILKKPEYTQAAIQAADFILQHMRDGRGRLLHSYADGKARLDAYLDDYAFLVDGLIALHRATGDQRWLKGAGELTDLQVKLFIDEARGGWYFTARDHETLIARSKQPTDDAIPAGSSVTASNLIYLAKHLGVAEYRNQAENTLKGTTAILTRAPRAAPRLAVAVGQWIAEP